MKRLIFLCSRGVVSGPIAKALFQHMGPSLLLNWEVIRDHWWRCQILTMMDQWQKPFWNTMRLNSLDILTNWFIINILHNSRAPPGWALMMTLIDVADDKYDNDDHSRCSTSPPQQGWASTAETRQKWSHSCRQPISPCDHNHYHQYHHNHHITLEFSTRWPIFPVRNMPYRTPRLLHAESPGKPLQTQTSFSPLIPTTSKGWQACSDSIFQCQPK